MSFLLERDTLHGAAGKAFLTINGQVKEFEEKFGPMGETSRDTSRWAWINGPWPWEREANE